MNFAKQKPKKALLIKKSAQLVYVNVMFPIIAYSGALLKYKPLSFSPDKTVISILPVDVKSLNIVIFEKLRCGVQAAVEVSYGFCSSLSFQKHSVRNTSSWMH